MERKRTNETDPQSVFAVMKGEEVVDVWNDFEDACEHAKEQNADKVVCFAKDEKGDYNRPIVTFQVDCEFAM